MSPGVREDHRSKVDATETHVPAHAPSQGRTLDGLLRAAHEQSFQIWNSHFSLCQLSEQWPRGLAFHSVR